MGWPGRATKREEKWQLLRGRSIFAMDWPGRATEHDWTRRKMTYFRRNAQPFLGIGQVKRKNAK